MEDAKHDTIDLKEELDSEPADGAAGAGDPARALADVDERLGDVRDVLGDIDETLADGSLEVAARKRHTGLIELMLVTVANAIWAVVGLVLWLPQTVRAVLWAALRTVHAALTQQSSGRAVAGIQRVSRSYVDRFLSRRSEQASVGRRHELRPFRLVGEVLWTVGFYLLILKWLAPERFSPVWQRIVEGAQAARSLSVEAWTLVKGWLTPDLAGLDFTRVQVAGILLVASLVGLALGFWLGRRGR